LVYILANKKLLHQSSF